jgi:hypothetical protein
VCRLRYAGKLAKLYPDDPMQAMKVDEIIGVQEDLSAKIGVTIYVGMRPETYGYPADWPAEEKAACQKKVALRLKLYLKKTRAVCQQSPTPPVLCLV